MRAGNLMYNKENKICIVKEVYKTRAKIQMISGAIDYCPIEDLHGIQLAEKWILRFGYKYDTTTSHEPCYFNGILGISKIGLFKNDWQWFWLKDFKGFAPIKFVHEMQNQHHHQTARELIIKEFV